MYYIHTTTRKVRSQRNDILNQVFHAILPPSATQKSFCHPRLSLQSYSFQRPRQYDSSCFQFRPAKTKNAPPPSLICRAAYHLDWQALIGKNDTTVPLFFFIQLQLLLQTTYRTCPISGPFPFFSHSDLVVHARTGADADTCDIHTADPSDPEGLSFNQL